MVSRWRVDKKYNVTYRAASPSTASSVPTVRSSTRSSLSASTGSTLTAPSPSPSTTSTTTLATLRPPDLLPLQSEAMLLQQVNHCRLPLRRTFSPHHLAAASSPPLTATDPLVQRSLRQPAIHRPPVPPQITRNPPPTPPMPAPSYRPTADRGEGPAVREERGDGPLPDQLPEPLQQDPDHQPSRVLLNLVQSSRYVNPRPSKTMLDRPAGARLKGMAGIRESGPKETGTTREAGPKELGPREVEVGPSKGPGTLVEEEDRTPDLPL